MKLKFQEKIFEISMSTRTSRGYRLLEKFRKMLLHPGAMTEIQTVFFGKIDNVLLAHSLVKFQLIRTVNSAGSFWSCSHGLR